MGTAEERLGYQVSERTRFGVRVEIHETLGEAPEVEWIRFCRSLEGAQRGYLALQERTGYGSSQFGFGEVFDEAGQLVATISYNGRLWAPSPNGRGPGWRPGIEPVAEAPLPVDERDPALHFAIRDMTLDAEGALFSDEDPGQPAPSKNSGSGDSPSP